VDRNKEPVVVRFDEKRISLLSHARATPKKADRQEVKIREKAGDI